MWMCVGLSRIHVLQRKATMCASLNYMQYAPVCDAVLDAVPNEQDGVIHGLVGTC